MTIDKAIDGLKGELQEAKSEGALKAVEYLQLGIEALELIKNVRQQKAGYLNPLPSYLLPSEE